MSQNKFLIPLFVLLCTFFFSCHLIKRRDISDSPGKDLSDQQKQAHLSIFLDANKQKILGNYSEAGALFAECIRKNPKDDVSYYELASILSQDKKYDDALILAKEAVSLNPKNEWYQILLAEIYSNLKQPANALKIYEKLIRNHPQKTDYYYELAMLYLFSQRYADAINTYNQLEKIIGINEDLSVQKQTIYLYNREPEKAIEEAKKLIQAFPSETKHRIMLADIYLSSNKKDKAFSIYEDILKNDSLNEDIHLALADYYQKTGNQELYFDNLKKAFANINVNTDKKIKILLNYYSSTENNRSGSLLRQAYELLDILIKTHPEDAIVYSIYADFLSRDKKLQQAKEMFLKVIELDKNRYPVWEELLFILSETQDYNGLDTLSKQALELYPEQALLYLFNGYAQFHFKRYDQAVAVFTDGLVYAVFNSKLSVEFYMYLGECYNHLKKYPESDAAFENALKIAPENIGILNNYSYYLSLRNEKLDKAKNMSKKANEIKPDISSYQDTYAWILFRLGEYNDALIWIEKAIANKGDKNYIILEHYGDILFLLNKKENALEQWKKSKELGNPSDTLKNKIDSQSYIP
ncbi:MAG: tetratricopeptide repeat protein [Bacteroidetes bacterium ADurb.Bin408]|nr:MAG: tetratricopeptide repeat protein [Bacteroidetes bacterium ADurb.Bin408]